MEDEDFMSKKTGGWLRAQDREQHEGNYPSCHPFQKPA